jgi:hypothetical protein
LNVAVIQLRVRPRHIPAAVNQSAIFEVAVDKVLIVDSDNGTYITPVFNNFQVDARTALDLCQRTESQAVLAGSIASFGSQYVIGMNAVNCQTGGSIARESAQAATKEKILDVLNRSVMNLRQKLGESLGSVERFDTHLERATTPSLEALQAYTKGRLAMLAGNDPQAAVPLFDQAIQADPSICHGLFIAGTELWGAGRRRFAAAPGRHSSGCRPPRIGPQFSSRFPGPSDGSRRARL